MQQITGASCFPAGYVRNVPLKGPHGTEFEDGVRTGPSFPGVMRFRQDVAPGMLMAPVYLWTVNQPYGSGVANGINVPAAFLYRLPTAVAVPANTTTKMLPAAAAVREPNVVAVPVETPLPAQTLVPGYDFGNPGRCLTYYGAVAVGGAAIQVTAVGYDVYGQPMMETATLDPTWNSWTGAKAFGVVTQCYASSAAAIAANTVVGVAMSNTFGLPYWIQSPVQVLSSNSNLPGAAPLFGYVNAGLPVTSIPASNSPDARGTVEFFPVPGVAVANASFRASLVIAVSGFDARLSPGMQSDAFAGYATLGGTTLPVTQQSVMPYIPRDVYMLPGFPNFDAVFDAKGQIQKGASGLMPVLPNAVTQYGAEQFWDESLALTLPV